MVARLWQPIVCHVFNGSGSLTRAMFLLTRQATVALLMLILYWPPAWLNVPFCSRLICEYRFFHRNVTVTSKSRLPGLSSAWLGTVTAPMPLKW